VTAAQLTLKTAQNNLADAVLTAPTAGTIASVNGAAGQYISGGATAAVSTSATSTASTSSSAFITLSDLTAAQVSAAISEADIGKIQPGQKVNFTVTGYPNRTFSGTVAAIEPAGTTTSNVVTYTVLISVDPTDVQLLPDMTATVGIITQQADGVVLVPAGAVSNGKVSVLQNGTVTPVAVQTGISDGVNTQIVSGLEPGAQVVTGTSSGPSTKSTTTGKSILSSGGPGAGPRGG
jgi:multidrug efflux pump subunit AcrA (membrane-fusion protein)